MKDMKSMKEGLRCASPAQGGSSGEGVPSLQDLHVLHGVKSVHQCHSHGAGRRAGFEFFAGPRKGLPWVGRSGVRKAMPRKIRQLIADLEAAGFAVASGGKGSHRKFRHARFNGAVVLSGKDGDDAHHYQEKQIRNAIHEVTR